MERYFIYIYILLNLLNYFIKAEFLSALMVLPSHLIIVIIIVKNGNENYWKIIIYYLL